MNTKILFQMFNIIRNYEKLSPSSSLVALNFYLYNKFFKDDNSNILKFFPYVNTISDKTINYLNGLSFVEPILFEDYLSFVQRTFRGENNNGIIPVVLIDFINFNINFEDNINIATNFLPLSKDKDFNYTLFDFNIPIITSTIFILNKLNNDFIKHIRSDIISIGSLFNKKFKYVITNLNDNNNQFLYKDTCFFNDDINNLKFDLEFYNFYDIEFNLDTEQSVIQYDTKKKKIPLFEVEIYQSLQILEDDGFATFIISKKIFENNKYSSYFKELFSKYSLKSIVQVPSETWSSIGSYFESYIIVLQNKKPNLKDDKFNILLPNSLGVTSTGAYIDISDLYQKFYFNNISIFDNSNFLDEPSFFQYSIKDFLKNNSFDLDNLYIDKNYDSGNFYKLSELIAPVKRKVIISNINHKKISISIKDGVSCIDINNSSLSKKTYYEVKKGDFVLSKLSTHKGGFGIVDETCDGALISNSFLSFEIIRPDLINPDFLSEMLKKEFFLNKFENIVSGISGRKYINIDKFLDFKVKLINIDEQNNLIDKIQTLKNEIKSLNNELNDLINDI